MVGIICPSQSPLITTDMQHAFTIPQFIDAYGVSRNTVYEEIARGRLASYQLGRRRYISANAAAEWQKRLEDETAIKRGFVDLNSPINDPIVL